MDALAYDLKNIALGSGEGAYLTRTQRHRGLQLVARELSALGFKLPGAGSLKPRHVVRQNRSKLTETASQALSTAPIPVGGKAVNGVLTFFMALLSFRGISTPSLPAQGEQRRSSYFNIPRGNSSLTYRLHVDATV